MDDLGPEIHEISFAGLGEWHLAKGDERLEARFVPSEELRSQYGIPLITMEKSGLEGFVETREQWLLGKGATDRDLETDITLAQARATLEQHEVAFIQLIGPESAKPEHRIYLDVEFGFGPDPF